MKKWEAKMTVQDFSLDTDFMNDKRSTELG